MNCPQCKNELRRSKKDPSYGLCDHCRKKFRWVESSSRPTPKRNSSPKGIPETSDRRRRPQPPVRFKTPRLVMGILSIFLFLLVTFQSCAAGLGNMLAENKEVSGSAGLLVALCMLIAGISTIAMRKKESSASFLVPAIVFIVGAILSSANVGSYSDLAIWSVLTAIFGALHLLFLFISRDSNRIVTFLIPILVVVIVAVFTFVSKSDEKDSATNTKQKTAKTTNTKKDTKTEKDDGLLNFDGEGYNITYVRHEVSADYEGKPCILVYYTFTNKGEENTSAMTKAFISAFQNGTECNTAILSDTNESINNYMAEVQPGASVEVCQSFLVADMSDVTLEASDLFAVDGAKDTQIIKLQ